MISNCDGCSEPQGPNKSIFVYGCEGDFCHKCRHGTGCDCDEAESIDCSTCDNFVLAGQYTEQELVEDGWLLEPVVYCPRCGPDDQKEDDDSGTT